jgi:hypothetical protein
MSASTTYGFNDRVGDIRPSQLLYTYGVGSIVDLQHTSVIVLGIDDWPEEYTERIEEPRLLAAVRTALGYEVDGLRLPPRAPESMVGVATQKIGVPVAAFPRWLVCPWCRLLAPIGSGLFRLQAPYNHPEEAAFRHESCNKAKNPTVLPVRFVMACENGHLDDFPWVTFVHNGRACPTPRLQMIDRGATGQAADVLVRCVSCDVARSMSQAFGETSNVAFSECSGRMPQLRSHDDVTCGEVPKAMLLGASNSWFASVLTAFAIPTEIDQLGQFLESRLALFNELEDASEIRVLRRIKKQEFVEIIGYTDEEIWEKLEEIRNHVRGINSERQNLKKPEWDRFIYQVPTESSRDFQLRAVDVPSDFTSAIFSVVLAERLREVRAFIGFNRVRGAGDLGDISGTAKAERLAPISRSAPEWVPASDVRGEGIFIRFNESAVEKWERRIWDDRRVKSMADARRAYYRNRKLSDIASIDDAGLLRKALLHSFSHALMRALALESGYNTASLRERIYSLPPSEVDGPMAGVLIYTAASDSEGTLGGLVRQGETERFGLVLERALREMEICASDPLCAEHEPDSDGHELHGAACHACLFAPETSCELGNQWLDRSFLVPTFTETRLGFFR